MDQLPIEIAHIIFSQLRPSQVASLRLVCKAFATLGLQYLLPEFHLIFKSSSFEHLREVSEHPLISQHVESLYYEADALDYYDNMEEWKDNIIVPGWYNSISSEELRPPSPTASERETRAYARRMKKACAEPRYTSSNKQLRSAYEEYKRCILEQELIRSNGYNKEIIMAAMRKMPGLKSIELSLECCLYEGRSTKVDRAFVKTLQTPYGDDGQEEQYGVPQLRSLLQGACKAGLPIETLRCGNVHWTFLKEDQDIFNQYKHAVRSLQTLALYVATRIEGDGEVYGDPYHSEILLCFEYLAKTGRLREFITAAPKLNELILSFDWDNPKPPARLTDIVGSFTWLSLRAASFTTISTNDEELVCFYKRHANSLRDIRLDTIELDKGSWCRLLQTVRKILKLETATIAGRLTSEDPGETYFLDLPPELNGGKKSAVSVMVESYLVAGGEGPLLDLNNEDR